MLGIQIVNRWRNLDARTRWLSALYGPWMLGALICLLNHVFFSMLDNKDTNKFNPTRIDALKSVFPLAVRGCMVASATTAFVPILWSALPNKPLSVEVLDSALQLPAFAPALKIVFSGSLQTLLVPILATLNVLSYAAIAIAPPAALIIEPMPQEITTMTVPKVDFSMGSGYFTIFGENWSYSGPGSHLLQLVQDMLTIKNLVTWSAPDNCGVGCSYNITYDAPLLKCNDYIPEPRDPHSRIVYTTSFNIHDNYPVLDMAVWPTLGMRTEDSFTGAIPSTAPLGVKCTFHLGRYTANVTFQGSASSAEVTRSDLLSNDTLIGPSLGFPITSSCPWDSNSYYDESSDPPCVITRTYLNTWAYIEAFSSLLVGTISISPQPTRFEINSNNTFLLSSVWCLFFYSEHPSESFFFFDPLLTSGNQSLSNALESVFARATLSFTSYAEFEHTDRKPVEIVKEAYAQPFATRYAYNSHVLWLAYSGALITVMAPALLACFFIWKGFVLTDETTLSRVLVTTRGDSLNIIKGMSLENIDTMVLRYDHVRARNDWEDGMGFMVVLKGEEQDVKLSEDEIYLLSKA